MWAFILLPKHTCYIWNIDPYGGESIFLKSQCDRSLEDSTCQMSLGRRWRLWRHETKLGHRETCCLDQYVNRDDFSHLPALSTCFHFLNLDRRSPMIISSFKVSFICQLGEIVLWMRRRCSDHPAVFQCFVDTAWACDCDCHLSFLSPGSCWHKIYIFLLMSTTSNGSIVLYFLLFKINRLG